jgi:hypothetical protein
MPLPKKAGPYLLLQGGRHLKQKAQENPKGFSPVYRKTVRSGGKHHFQGGNDVDTAH